MPARIRLVFCGSVEKGLEPINGCHDLLEIISAYGEVTPQTLLVNYVTPGIDCPYRNQDQDERAYEIVITMARLADYCEDHGMTACLVAQGAWDLCSSGEPDHFSHTLFISTAGTD